MLLSPPLLANLMLPRLLLLFLLLAPPLLLFKDWGRWGDAVVGAGAGGGEAHVQVGWRVAGQPLGKGALFCV